MCLDATVATVLSSAAQNLLQVGENWSPVGVFKVEEFSSKCPPGEGSSRENSRWEVSAEVFRDCCQCQKLEGAGVVLWVRVGAEGFERKDLGL